MNKDLFDVKIGAYAPLADRMRPDNLQEFIGQNEIIESGKPLRKLIEEDNVTSLIFWGPPGSGKTTLAHIIAQETNSYFVSLSAVTSNTKELKKVFQEAEERIKYYNKKTIVFIDEIHRFSKSQQDAFLPFVERGTITLIGATTENPSFEVISPLISRSRVIVLKRLTEENIKMIISRAVKNKTKGLGKEQIKINEDALSLLARFSDGDARMALNTLEYAVKTASTQNKTKIITKKHLVEVTQKSSLHYDKQGEEHFNLISALHKSMRNSDADASLYWLARMLEAGEDPKYIARRMIRFASEDVGNADPQALGLAVAAFQAVERVGLPEGNLALAQAAVYLARAPKDNSLYMAYDIVKEDIKKFGSLPTPLSLRNPETKLMKEVGYGQGYKYAHNYKQKKTDMVCLPEELKNRKYLNNGKRENN